MEKQFSSFLQFQVILVLISHMDASITPKLYWTDQSTDKIQRASMDGRGIEDLVILGLDRPYGIELDLHNGKMYWTDWGTNSIQRANLDGSNVEYIITTGISKPLHIVLVPEPATLSLVLLGGIALAKRRKPAA